MQEYEDTKPEKVQKRHILHSRRSYWESLQRQVMKKKKDEFIYFPSSFLP
jgi:hypothetical protein